MRRAIALVAALVLAAPAQAEVHESSPAGFVLRHTIDAPSSPEQAWVKLVNPREWWDSLHTYSGDAANMSMDARAGGCFCEILPNKESPRAAPRGSVEHMRVIYVEEPRALRLSGALGPLQSGAAPGVLTVVIKPTETGVRFLWEYVYGGYVRGGAEAMALAVDKVLVEQALRLGKSLGAAPRVESDFLRAMEGGLAPDEPAEVEKVEQAGQDGGQFTGR